jgi:spore germination protein GerM
VKVRIFFLKNGQLYTAKRECSRENIELEVVRELLCGPTEKEAKKGVYTEIPVTTKVLNVVHKGEIAEVDLSEEFNCGGGLDSITARVVQIVWTLTEIESIKAVKILIGGNEVNYLTGEGLIANKPFTRKDIGLTLID